MEFLRRDDAPITEAAWKEIDDTARRVLTASLIGRRVVDVVGPLGWDYSAVPLGRLQLQDQAVEGVEYGLREVQPLVELRASFELDAWELDNLSRGARDVDLDAVEEAALQAARFEDLAIFNGLSAAGIDGVVTATFPEGSGAVNDEEQFLEGVSAALAGFQEDGVEGPYALVLGSDTYQLAATATTGYPLLKRARALTGGPVLQSPQLEGGLVMSTRGGDFELTLGADFSVGYDGRDGRTLTLFLTESFTFRVLEPKAVTGLTPSSRSSSRKK